MYQYLVLLCIDFVLYLYIIGFYILLYINTCTADCSTRLELLAYRIAVAVLTAIVFGGVAFSVYCVFTRRYFYFTSAIAYQDGYLNLLN